MHSLLLPRRGGVGDAYNLFLKPFLHKSRRTLSRHYFSSARIRHESCILRIHDSCLCYARPVSNLQLLFRLYDIFRKLKISTDKRANRMKKSFSFLSECSQKALLTTSCESPPDFLTARGASKVVRRQFFTLLRHSPALPLQENQSHSVRP